MTATKELQRLSGKVFINGEYRTSASDNFLDVINPATEKVIGKYSETTEAEVVQAIADANAAQKIWKKVNALTRAELMHKVAQNMRQAKGILGDMLTREMGKPYKETTDEVEWSASAMDYYSEVARHDNGNVVGPAVDGQFHFTIKEPMGVVVSILPFNYPFCLFCWEAAAAIACGNAVILKPSENTALTSLKFMEAFPPARRSGSMPARWWQCRPTTS